MADVLTRPVRVAFEGCGHGTLNAIYSSVAESARARGWDDGVDVLIIGGDFQAVRNAADLTIMSCPAKYRRLGDFHDYYAGRRAAPCLTLFVGGNHEASSHLSELFHGGWVAPRIYYMGAAGVVSLGGVRIAGLSGIWKGHDYRRPHCERLPFGDDDVKSCYHVREVDVRRLLMVRTQVDVGLSHDWPRGVELHGDHGQLFRCKPHFRADSRDGRLGSRAAEWVMDRLRPQYWFSAHLHCKFTAIRTYDADRGRPGAGSAKTAEDGQDMSGDRPAAKKETNPDEIELGDDDDDGGGSGGTVMGSAKHGQNGGGQAVPKEANPDEIDLDGDDDDDDDGGGGAAVGSVVPGQRVVGQAAPKEASPDKLKRGGGDDDDDNGNDGGTPALSAENLQRTGQEAAGKGETNPAEIKLDDTKLDDDGGGGDIATGSVEHRRHNTTEEVAAANPDELELDDDHDPRSPDKEADWNPVPADLRAQLPASFARPGAHPEQQQPALAQSQDQSQAPGQPVPPAITNKQVRFLALDKCLPGRHFIQLLEIAPLARPGASPASPAGGPLKLKYDPEWLAINRAMAPLILTPPGDRGSRAPADLGEAHYAPLVDEARAWVDENIVRKAGGAGLTIPENFAVTAPPHRPGDPETVGEQPTEWTNPQTAAFCEMLGIPNLWDAPEEERTRRRAERPPPSSFGGRGGGRGRGGGGGGGGGDGGGGWNRRGRGGRGGGHGRGRI